MFLSVLDSTHFVNWSETLINFLSAGVLMIFQNDICVSVSCRHSCNTWTASIIICGSESGFKLLSRYPRRVSKTMHTAAAQKFDFVLINCA
jgi:hypothetical protein